MQMQISFKFLYHVIDTCGTTKTLKRQFEPSLEGKRRPRNDKSI